MAGVLQWDVWRRGNVCVGSGVCEGEGVSEGSLSVGRVWVRCLLRCLSAMGVRLRLLLLVLLLMVST